MVGSSKMCVRGGVVRDDPCCCFCFTEFNLNSIIFNFRFKFVFIPCVVVFIFPNGSMGSCTKSTKFRKVMGWAVHNAHSVT